MPVAAAPPPQPRRGRAGNRRTTGGAAAGLGLLLLALVGLLRAPLAARGADPPEDYAYEYEYDYVRADPLSPRGGRGADERSLSAPPPRITSTWKRRPTPAPRLAITLTSTSTSTSTTTTVPAATTRMKCVTRAAADARRLRLCLATDLVPSKV